VSAAQRAEFALDSKGVDPCFATECSPSDQPLHRLTQVSVRGSKLLRGSGMGAFGKPKILERALKTHYSSIGSEQGRN
jgi:hypothetical protein